MPHKFVLAKPSDEEKTISHSTAGNNVQNLRIGGGMPGIQTLKKPVPNAEAATPSSVAKTSDVKVVQNLSDPLDLVVRPKGEVQYIR